MSEGFEERHYEACPQLPGTILRIFIPAGTAINLLNLIELASPGGICIIIRLPFLAGVPGSGSCVGAAAPGFLDAVRAAGGTVEVVKK